jgi:hypothetical protein
MNLKISFKDKKTTVNGTVRRTALYAGVRIIEVNTEGNESLYLIFYKNNLIYGDKLETIDPASFIHQAFQEGLVIESLHPLVKALIPDMSITIPAKTKLFAQLQNHFQPQELSFIATTLDSFFEKEELFKIIEKYFFHYRRNGNFLKSFQILQMVKSTAPELFNRLYSHQFSAYAHFYETSDLPSILSKDPLYAELHCFRHRSKPNFRLSLEELLRNQNRPLEVLLLWLEQPAAESIETNSKIACQFVTQEEWLACLVAANLNVFSELPEAKGIIEKMIQEGKAEAAALLLLKHFHELPDSYDGILNQLWGNLKPGFVAANLDEFMLMLQQLAEKGHLELVDQKIYNLAVILMEENDLKTVHDKLVSFQDTVTIQKLKRMAELEEDPDRMMELGDCYSDFKQYNKALDCFFWEMELDPQNTVPVQKISRMYQLKGMREEAAAYQKVLQQLVKNREIG